MKKKQRKNNGKEEVDGKVILFLLWDAASVNFVAIAKAGQPLRVLDRVVSVRGSASRNRHLDVPQRVITLRDEAEVYNSVVKICKENLVES